MHLLRLRNLTHGFGSGPARKDVLHGIDLDLSTGEIVILTGPSGSGKTTLLTLAGALRSVQAGSVRTFGHELAGASRATQLEVRRRIGFIFQQPNLLEALTAAQNVQLALAWTGPIAETEARHRALEQLEAVGLAPFADRYPSQLSGGQRQRVAIARALVVRPHLILADEPTSALDRATGREAVDLLQQLARRGQCAILLVTHDHRILDIADRHLGLEDGHLVSLTRVASQQTHHVLDGLARTLRNPNLAPDIAALDETAFFRFLTESNDDLGELCRVIDTTRAHLSDSLLDRLLIALTFKLGQWLEADRVTLFLIDWPARKLRSRVAQSHAQGLLGIELDLDSGVAGHVAREGVTMNLPDAYDSPLFNPEVDRRTGYRTRSLLCVPIRDHAGQVFAVAQLLNRRNAARFSNQDEQRFDSFLKPLGRLLEQVLSLEAALPLPRPSSPPTPRTPGARPPPGSRSSDSE